MSWIEVRATLPPSLDSSVFIDTFREFGIENTQEDGATLVGCLVDVEGSAAQVEKLAQALTESGAVDVTSKPFEEQNWAEVWKQFFKPRRIGKRFVVRPTWEEFESASEDLTIVLDPGEAFGTGDHPTTRMCLMLMEGAGIAGRKIADIGCGSGILSIGACLLGAASVDAVDIEAASVQVSKDNARLNRVEFRAIVGEGVRCLLDPTDAISLAEAAAEWEQDEVPLRVRPEIPSGLPNFEPVYDVVISNIISAILIRMAPDVAMAVVPGGYWIVSGIIDMNWPDVLAAAEQVGFTLEELLGEGDWKAARFVKTP
jgi:ribosomal protein L11 methyltransferase